MIKNWDMQVTIILKRKQLFWRGGFPKDSLAPGAKETIVSCTDSAKEHNEPKCCSATHNSLKVFHLFLRRDELKLTQDVIF